MFLKAFQDAERPRWTECPSEDVCREVVIFSRKVLKDRVERTGRSRQADVAMDGNWSRPVRIRTATHFSQENSHR